MVNTDTLVLGADGGGTKTTGLLADRRGTVIARLRGEGSNQFVIGMDNAARNLAELIAGLALAAGHPVGSIGRAVLGLAGMGALRDRQTLTVAIQSRLQAMGHPPVPLAIETDGRVALEGAFNGGPGIVVVAGTGSVVMGKSARGEAISIGGWGRVIGDEGSGYFIGLEALKAVSREIDGRGEAGRLRISLASRFGLDTRDRITAAVYREKFDIPSIAPAVLDAADAGDPVAIGILTRASAELSGQIVAAVDRLGLRERAGLVMIGGLVDHDTVYARMLAAAVRRHVPDVDVRAPLNGPEHGAVLLAITGLEGD
ncbi:MAG TPA: BadF/BadG/BcrA/BcrD ATPase family protein [Bacteroidota bacterium]|nr:BadF/BadG/BcrA/BcrD ATPase family protein [Bacteroidota bacterium]